MQTAARSNLFLTDFPSFGILAGVHTATKYGEFYQHLLSELRKGIHNKQFFLRLAQRIVDVADQAYTIRRSDVIEQASELLLNLTLPPQYQKVGHYYQALSRHQQGLNNEAYKLFEKVTDDAPLRYRARATQLLGMMHHAQGGFDSALPLYLESCRMAVSDNLCDPSTMLTAQQNIAVMKSMYGDHRAAVTHLETLFPLVQLVRGSQPYKYYLFLNSLAVELAEVGRIEEARNISKIVLASPYAIAYPEWRETSDDIERKAYRSPRSFTSFNHRLLNTKNVVLYLSVPGPGDTTDSEQYHRNPFQQGSVTILEDWKRKMVKEPNGDQNDKDDLKNATEKDLYLKLMELMAKRDLSSKQLRRVIDFVERISSEPDSDPKDD